MKELRCPLAKAMFVRLAAITLSLILSNAGVTFGATYGELKAAGIKRCEAIDASEFQSGLMFNPDGYRSYYLRSECMQRIAVAFRDEALCAQVKERRSLLASSWGYAQIQCQKLVREGIAADRKTLEDKKAQYLQSPVRLKDFRIEANGNGRDFDIIPAFVGERGDGYSLRFEILGTPSTPPTVLLHSAGYHINGRSNLRIYVRQEDIRNRFPQFTVNHPYIVRASLVLTVGTGSMSGKWSEQFAEETFPEKERTQIIDKEIRF